MSLADELLNNVAEDQINSNDIGSSVEPHIVINADRTITVPDVLKNIAVQFDHNIETVTFDCPRYWDDHDLSEMQIYVNYMTPAGTFGSFPAENRLVDTEDDTVIHFNWTISRNVTVKNGTLTFLVCAKMTDSDGAVIHHWNSERNSDMYISEGLEADEEISERYPDIITQILSRLDYHEFIVNKAVTTDAFEYELSNYEFLINRMVDESSLAERVAVLEESSGDSGTLQLLDVNRGEGFRLAEAERVPGQLLHSWNLTDETDSPLMDLVTEADYASAYGVDDFYEDGAHINESPGFIYFGPSILRRNVRVEVDFGDMNYVGDAEDRNGRVITFSKKYGFVFKGTSNTNKWGIFENTWTYSALESQTNPNAYANKTLVMEITGTGQVRILCDDVLQVESSRALFGTGGTSDLTIGSREFGSEVDRKSAFNNMVIKAVRVYEGGAT